MPSFKLTRGDERDETIEEVIEWLRGENYNVSGVIKDALEAHFRKKGWWDDIKASVDARKRLRNQKPPAQ